ncbi:MDR family MFS transporter [uncultured Amnibacterium sp.]|uniref:MDR family MFS transporter n=1 Tax=uncultured Amnibacterium sp. TaxID=1631851 RepID=UPI0035CC823E
MSSSPPSNRLEPQVRRVATVVIVGGLAAIFDTTIVSVALHTLAGQLHAAVAAIQWVSTGYLLALGVTIPLVGWAQGRFGGKRVWMFALLVFLAGSIASSLAWNAPSLIAFRVVQGIGGGLMAPLMSTLVMQAAGGKALGRAMSVVSLPASLGPILGPVLGGTILSFLDWRWLFWVNVPFCVVGFILAWILLPADTLLARARLDVLGFALLSPGIVGILYGISNASRSGGFTRPDVLVPAILGIVLLGGFALHASRVGERALIDVRLFTRRAVTSSSALLFLSGGALFGAMLLLPLYFQELRGATAFTAGVLLIPQGIGTLLSRSAAGRLTDSIGPKWVSFVGFVIVGAATIPFALATSTSNEWVLAGVLLVRGFGFGAVTTSLFAAAFVGLDRTEVPHASIITRIALQIGGSFGVAILAVTLDRPQAINLGRTDSSVAAFDQAFWWSIGFTAVAVALTLAIPTRSRASVSGSAVADTAKTP